MHEPLGLTPFLAGVPAMLENGNGAMRQLARLAELGDVRAMHAEVVDRTRRSAEEVLADGDGERGMSTGRAAAHPRGAGGDARRAPGAHARCATCCCRRMATFIDMAGIRLGMGPTGDEARDLAQARQAIEALRALLGVAERELGAAQVRPFREPLAVLQMAYSRAVEEPGGEGAGRRPRARRRAAAGSAAAARGDDPAARLWVPPGTPPGRPLRPRRRRAAPSGAVW